MESQKIAELLKKQRESMGISIPNVVDRTKIKRSYIEAMETGNFSIFENQTYIRNFVRTYARFLKISESQIMSMLGSAQMPPAEKPADEKRELPATVPQPGLPAEIPAAAGKPLFSAGFLVVAIGIVIGGFFLLFKSCGGSENRLEQGSESGQASVSDSEILPVDQPISDTASTSPHDVIQTAPASEAPAQRAAASNSHKAEMTPLDDVWLSWISENARFQKLLRRGDKQVAVFEKNLRLIVGNPSGLKLKIDGDDISLDTGKVFDRIFRVREDGVLVVEPATSGAVKRFQTNQPSENFQ